MIRRSKLCKQTLENTLSLLYLLSVVAGKFSHQWPAGHLLWSAGHQQWTVGPLPATSAKSSNVLLKQNRVGLEIEISANVLLCNRGTQ
ncbi:hypothetical protein CsSME_00045725 [Camellia sinensis var. sinensis]